MIDFDMTIELLVAEAGTTCIDCQTEQDSSKDVRSVNVRSCAVFVASTDMGLA